MALLVHRVVTFWLVCFFNAASAAQRRISGRGDRPLFKQLPAKSKAAEVANALHYAIAHVDEIAPYLSSEEAEALSVIVEYVAARASGPWPILSVADLTRRAHLWLWPETAAGIALASLSKITQTEAATTTEPPSDSKMKTLDSALWVSCAATLCIFVFFEFFHQKLMQFDLNAPDETDDEVHEGQLSRLLAGVRPLVSPYFSETYRSWCYASAVLLLEIINIGFGVIFVFWSKEFWDALQNKNADDFFDLWVAFMKLVFIMVLLGTYSSYIQQMLVIDWRQYLTQWLVTNWLQNKIFYRLQIGTKGTGLDNPDQRIADDVLSFCSSFQELSVGFFISTLQLFIYLPMLFSMSPDYAFGMYYCPGWLLYISILYSGLGTIIAHAVGQRLIVLNFSMQKAEANFRYDLIQIRDHSESIALSSSESCEASRLNMGFGTIIWTYWNIMKYQKRLGFFTTFYSITSGVFPYLVLAPSYFKGQISLGSMFMLMHSLGYVKNGLDFIVSRYASIAECRATVDRLNNFVSALDEEGLPPEACALQTCNVKRLDAPLVSSGSKAAISATDLVVDLPGKIERVMWRGASLTVCQGEFVLLSAPEGTGKSCFLRALAGIWPGASGSVYIPDNVVFLPQRPFVPRGTLKQAVAYPSAASNFGDEEIRQALKTARVDAVLQRPLDEFANWSMELSGGEQQRFAMARILLRRPQVLVMDEPTSALSNDGAIELFTLLRKPGTLPEGAAVVTVSHDVALLRPLHDRHCLYSENTKNWITEN